ncbi:MAG: hypothetical protein PF447_10385 [Spirochaetaceae bacterium]|jgi:hypothetical protein|nr:hypothetical protein [Spirochaetaceae bacterium]
MKYYVLIALLSIFSISLFSEEITFIQKNTVYANQGENPLNIHQGEQWNNLGLIDFSNLKREASFQQNGFNYQIRFKVLINEAMNCEKSAIQIRFSQSGENSIYHVPLDGIQRSGDLRYSNWYISSEEFAQLPWRGAVAIRLLTPPGQSVDVEILSLEMELWGNPVVDNEENGNIALASAGSFIGAVEKQDQSEQREEYLSASDAMDFSLDFIESIITGNIPTFFAALDDQIYSLNTGNSYSRFRINPPEGWDNYSIQDYLLQFQPKLISYNQYIELFPQWAESDRDWNPNPYTYLFMGNITSLEGLEESTDLLVFMVGRVNGQIKVIARPEF